MAHEPDLIHPPEGSRHGLVPLALVEPASLVEPPPLVELVETPATGPPTPLVEPPPLVELVETPATGPPTPLVGRPTRWSSLSKPLPLVEPPLPLVEPVETGEVACEVVVGWSRQATAVVSGSSTDGKRGGLDKLDRRKAWWSRPTGGAGGRDKLDQRGRAAGGRCAQIRSGG